MFGLGSGGLSGGLGSVGLGSLGLGSIGLENRKSILPSPQVPGLLGPDYSYADAVKLPSQVGVRDGDTIQSVTDAIGGAAYYIDTIGFGESSNKFSANTGVKPLGVNVWMKTGFTCSNGADMWTYLEGIPSGNALGGRVAAGLKEAGLPALRGLAPGILEDVQSALDPTPLMSAAFGSGYPQCRLLTKKVGDQDGNISKKDENGNVIYYIQNPETAFKGADGMYYQSRWTKESDLDKTVWTNTPKIYCPDGSSSSKGCSEGFCSSCGTNQRFKQLILVTTAAVGIFGLLYCIRARSKN
jgi:hypothetical protein